MIELTYGDLFGQTRFTAAFNQLTGTRELSITTKIKLSRILKLMREAYVEVRQHEPNEKEMKELMSKTFNIDEDKFTINEIAEHLTVVEIESLGAIIKEDHDE